MERLCEVAGVKTAEPPTDESGEFLTASPQDDHTVGGKPVGVLNCCPETYHVRQQPWCGDRAELI